jgi:hypothetical protein
MSKNELSYEYIRGLIEGEGCFSFSTIGYKGSTKLRIPAFILSMSKRDETLAYLIKEKLKIRNKIYEHKIPIRKDSYNRQPMITMIVRDIGQLKNIIVPLCYKKFHGNKGLQFEKWIGEIGSNPSVPKGYKFIHHLYEIGFYENVHDFDL